MNERYTSSKNLPLDKVVRPAGKDVFQYQIEEFLKGAKNLLTKRSALRGGETAGSVLLLGAVANPAAAQEVYRADERVNLVDQEKRQVSVPANEDKFRADSAVGAPAPDKPKSDNPDIPPVGTGGEETGVSDLAESFTREAINARLGALQDYEVLWSKDTNPDSFLGGEKILKLIIATYPGESAETIKKLLKLQNDPKTKGNLQYLKIDRRFAAGYLFTATDADIPILPEGKTIRDPRQLQPPITFPWGNNLEINGSRVISTSLIRVHPELYESVSGEASWLDGKLNLDGLFHVTYGIVKFDVYNESLSREARAFLADKGPDVSTEEIRDYLNPRTNDLKAAAEKEAERQALDSARRRYQAMPDRWYARPALMKLMEN